jgi:hypothetical protein
MSGCLSAFLAQFYRRRQAFEHLIKLRSGLPFRVDFSGVSRAKLQPSYGEIFGWAEAYSLWLFQSSPFRVRLLLYRLGILAQCWLEDPKLKLVSDFRKHKVLDR